MRVAVLGPLEVRTDDSAPVPMPSGTERLLLAVLAAGAPAAVSTGHLLQALDDGTTEAAREALRTHLGRLRAALEPGLPPRSSGQYVLRRGAGYVLALPRSDIDALHVADLTRHGRARLAEGDAAEAERVLTAALHLWRGRPYADWPDAEFADAQRLRLAEVRMEAETALREAAWRLVRQPAAAGGPASPRPAGDRRTFVPMPRLPDDGRRPATDALRDRAPEPGPDRDPTRGRRTGLTVALAALLIAVLVAAALAVRSERGAERAAIEPVPAMTDAERLAALSETEGPLDVSLLLAVQAVRLDDTTRTRDRLLAALRSLGRVERAVPFPGIPQQPVLSGGGEVLSVVVDASVVSWTMDAETQPHLVLPIPGEWGGWLVAAPSPTEPVVVGAGENLAGSWLRTLSAIDGTSRLLIEEGGLGGLPVDGVVTADGRRVLLLLVQPVVGHHAVATHWQVIDVDITDGTRRDTGVEGTVAVPPDGLGADFADDASTLVVWDGGNDAATLVDVPSGRVTAVGHHRRPAVSARFVALPSGAAQLWDDGAVTLIDRDGRTVQELDAHPGQVRDIVVAPDSTWGLTAGDGPAVFRWDIDPETGLWSDREELTGHDGGVVGADIDATGSRLFTESLDRRVIVWDMSTRGGIREDRARRFPFMDLEDLLREACDVVGRDLSRVEWRHYLPDREYRSTCTDLS
jgi:hypothetical protein